MPKRKRMSSGGSRKRRKTTSTRTRTKSRRRRSTRSRRVTFGKVRVRGSPIPREYHCVLTYERELGDMTWAGTGAHLYSYFNGNSLFDPELTGTGTQPYGFDQLAAWYKLYRVFASSITIQIVNGSDQILQAFLVPLKSAPTDPPATETDVERWKTHYRPKVTTINSVNAGGNIRWLKSFAKTTSVLGLHDARDEEDLQGAVTANPARTWRWTLALHHVDHTTAITTPIRGIFRLRYYTMFSDRKIFAQS